MDPSSKDKLTDAKTFSTSAEGQEEQNAPKVLYVHLAQDYIKLTAKGIDLTANMRNKKNPFLSALDALVNHVGNGAKLLKHPPHPNEEAPIPDDTVILEVYDQNLNIGDHLPFVTAVSETALCENSACGLSERDAEKLISLGLDKPGTFRMF